MRKEGRDSIIQLSFAWIAEDWGGDMCWSKTNGKGVEKVRKGD